QNDGNNRLNNVTVGTGVLDFSISGARVRLQGTTTLASGTALTLSSGSSILGFEQTVTTGNLTVDMTANNSFVSVEGNNTLTLGSGTTITHSSTGSSSVTTEVFAGGFTAAILNQGLIRNTAAGTLSISGDTFTNSG